MDCDRKGHMSTTINNTVAFWQNTIFHWKYHPYKKTSVNWWPEQQICVLFDKFWDSYFLCLTSSVSDRMMGSTSGLVWAVLAFLAWVSEAKDESKMTMPGARPAYADSYLCTAFSTKSLLKTNQAGVTYVTGFRPEADAKVRLFFLQYVCCTFPDFLLFRLNF